MFRTTLIIIVSCFFMASPKQIISISQNPLSKIVHLTMIRSVTSVIVYNTLLTRTSKVSSINHVHRSCQAQVVIIIQVATSRLDSQGCLCNQASSLIFYSRAMTSVSHLNYRDEYRPNVKLWCCFECKCRGSITIHTHISDSI